MATGGVPRSARCRDIHTVEAMARRNDRRRSAASQWRRVAITGAGVLAAAAATVAVVHTGDSATTIEHAAPNRTVTATPGPRTAGAPPTAVTVTLPGADVETPVSVPPSTVAAVPEAQSMVDPRLVVYTVAGNQRPNDPVTITYADENGALRTVENVTLPWSMTVVPTVPVNYVTASSAGSQLNCWITDGTGATVAAQVDNGINASCNR